MRVRALFISLATLCTRYRSNEPVDDQDFDDVFGEYEDLDEHFAYGLAEFSEEPWVPCLSFEGPDCHEENWEEPAASEVCPICSRKKDQPPPLIS